MSMAEDGSQPLEDHDGSDDSAASAKAGAGGDPFSDLEKMKVADRDEASIWLVALRDLALAAVLLTLFGAADTWARTSYLGIAKAVSVLDGLLVGALVAAVFHEWGHFIGARLGGGHSPLKPIKALPQVFDFDYQNNDAKSFRWMSIGGSVGNWGAVLLLAWAIPLVEVGPVALVSGAFGFSVFTALVEWPVIRKAAAGMDGLQALRTIPKDFVSRYLPFGLGSALGAFLFL